MPSTINIALIGLGNVNRSFLQVLEERGDQIAARYGLTFRIVGVADSSGVAVNPDGFDPAATRRFKEQGGKVSGLAGYRPGQTAAELVQESACELVLEASPVNLQHGEPGLSVVRTALQQGRQVVLANKGPLVLAFGELHALARRHGAGLAYSATVCGALPVINIGQRDLIAAQIRSVRGIFNSTSNFILSEMAAGRSYTAALAEAQRRGIAETDPTLDVEGWDTANKLVIIANSFLGVQVTLAAVQVQGITSITAEQLQAELQRGNTIKLLASAQATAQGYRFSVAPTVLPRHEFLAQCSGFEMGIELATDLYGTHSYKSAEVDALPTAAAMLRDAVNLQQRQQ